jgi:hypothetical protein
MYAYYFYRLIQRAQNVTATYSVVKDGISTGELSRYGFQLLYDSAHTPQTVNLGFSFANDPVQPIEIKSSPEKVADFFRGLPKNTRFPLAQLTFTCNAAPVLFPLFFAVARAAR